MRGILVLIITGMQLLISCNDNSLSEISEIEPVKYPLFYTNDSAFQISSNIYDNEIYVKFNLVNNTDSILMILLYKEQENLHPHNIAVYKKVFNRTKDLDFIYEPDNDFMYKTNNEWRGSVKFIRCYFEDVKRWKAVLPKDSIELLAEINMGYYKKKRNDLYQIYQNNLVIDSVSLSFNYDFVNHISLVENFKDSVYNQDFEHSLYQIHTTIKGYDTLNLDTTIDY